MKKLFIIAYLYMFFTFNFAYCETISGKIDKYDAKYQNKIVDFETQKPLNNAKISIPDLNYTTFSDENGTFRLNADINDKTVLFVEKEGYKVFSLTIDNNVLNNPLKLGIKKESPFDLQLSTDVIHLGDNMFSSNSANSNDFKLYANGHIYTKTFKKPSYGNNNDVIIKIGTIIGLDTKQAKEARQNNIARIYSSPAEIFVNGRKIGSLELNGDNIEVNIPKNILKEQNELMIQTGKNLFQTEYVDYDDIELANIRIEAREKHHFAGK